jgi:MFS family permease
MRYSRKRGGRWVVPRRFSLPRWSQLKAIPPRVMRQMPWRQIYSVEDRNAWNLYLDIAWFGVLNGVVTTFTSVFALRLGASDALLGWLSALPALVNVLWLIPAANIIERQRRRLPIILLSGFLQRLGYLLVALLPCVLLNYRAEALVVVITLTAFPAAMAGVAFISLLADAVPVTSRARVVSVRNMLLAGVSTLTVLIGGKLLDLIAFPINYQILFIAAFLTSLVSLHHVGRVRVPGAVVAAPQARSRSLLALTQSLKQVWSHRDFVRFSFGSFVFNWGLYLPVALYSIYRVKHLHASNTWIGLLTTVYNVTTVIAYVRWGRFTVKRGNRRTLLISSLGLALYPALTGLSPRLEPLLGVAVLGGVFGAGLNLALFNTMLQVCPSERRPSYVAIYNTLVNIAAFCAPLLGTFLSDRLDIRVALVIAGAVRLVGVAAFYWFSPRDAVT